MSYSSVFLTSYVKSFYPMINVNQISEEMRLFLFYMKFYIVYSYWHKFKHALIVKISLSKTLRKQITVRTTVPLNFLPYFQCISLKKYSVKIENEGGGWNSRS